MFCSLFLFFRKKISNSYIAINHLWCMTFLSRLLFQFKFSSVAPSCFQNLPSFDADVASCLNLNSAAADASYVIDRTWMLQVSGGRGRAKLRRDKEWERHIPFQGVFQNMLCSLLLNFRPFQNVPWGEISLDRWESHTRCQRKLNGGRYPLPVGNFCGNRIQLSFTIYQVSSFGYWYCKNCYANNRVSKVVNRKIFLNLFRPPTSENEWKTV